MSNSYVIDIETDGFLNEVSKIHCLYYKSNKEEGYLTEYKDIKKFLLKDSLILICHNIIRYDLLVLEKILNIKIEAKIVDTLAISWYLYPSRKSHGLESWGEYFNIKKPTINDWKNLKLEDYINRCKRDVEINILLWNKQIKYLKKIYDGEDLERILNYLNFKMDCIREQEEVKWSLDIKKCNNNLKILEEEKNKKKGLLIEKMCLKGVKKIVEKPKNLYRKDGSYTIEGFKWFKLLIDKRLPENYKNPLEIVSKNENPNPNSSQQVKEWLFSLGWKPETFKYVKKEKGEVKKIPQINLPFGQGICKSIKKLYDKEPLLENLENYYTLCNRINILKNIIKINKNGLVTANIGGLTNTLRYKHRDIVNLPRVSMNYGKYIRSVLISFNNHILFGSDMSSLEDKTKQHYMYFFDREYVNKISTNDFDPHLDLAVLAYSITKKEIGINESDYNFYKNFKDGDSKERYKKIKEIRGFFKVVNYSAIYGITANTLHRNLGIDLNKCVTLLDIYWKRNWAIKKVGESLEIKTIDNQMWQKNPTSNFWYILRSKKDSFATLNQGLGVYCFDSWVKKVREKGIKISAQFHDEIIFNILNNKKDIEKATKILNDSINEVNNELNLNVKLSIDIQYGKNYSEIH